MRDSSSGITVISREDAHAKRLTYEQVMRSCGKRSCQTCGGTRRAHGPYWYKSEWNPETKKKRMVYIGKELPVEAAEALRDRQLWADPAFRAFVYRAADVQADVARHQEEIKILSQTVTRLEEKLESREKLVKALSGENEYLELALRAAKARKKARGPLGFTDGSEPSMRADEVFRRLAHKYHPDHNPATVEFMRDLNELRAAYKHTRS